MRTGKTTAIKTIATPTPRPPREPVERVLLFASGGSYGKHSEIKVQKRAVGRKLEAARAGGYRLWNPSLGLDSGLVAEPGIPQEKPKKGRDKIFAVVHPESGLAWKSCALAGEALGVSGSVIYQSCENGVGRVKCRWASREEAELIARGEWVVETV